MNAFQNMCSDRQKIPRLLLFLALIPLTLGAQQNPPGGSITGDVICADTRLPARFAKVLLKRLPNENQREEVTSLPGAVTDLNGTFRIDGVPQGDYFIYAVLPISMNRHYAPRPRPTLLKELRQRTQLRSSK